MATIERGFGGDDRYRWDFGACSYANGWAQIDTKQDASYYGTWCNPTKFLIFNYAEGDQTLTRCDDAADFVVELRKTADWNKEAGYWLGIDPDEAMRVTFTELGLADLLHPHIE